MNNSLEIPWVEGFVLGNKAKELEKLVPGTEEHLFYSIIYNLNQKKNVEELLAKLKEKIRNSSKLRELTLRNLLMQYDFATKQRDKKKILREISDNLGIRHQHQPPPITTISTPPPSTLGKIKRRISKIVPSNQLAKKKSQSWYEELESDMYSDDRFFDANISLSSSYLPYYRIKGRTFEIQPENLLCYWTSGEMNNYPNSELHFLNTWKLIPNRLKLNPGLLFRNFTRSQMEYLGNSEPSLYEFVPFVIQFAEKFCPKNLDIKSIERKQYLMHLLKITRNLPPSMLTFKFYILHYLLKWSIDNEVERSIEVDDLFLEYCQLPRDSVAQFVSANAKNLKIRYGLKTLAIPGLPEITSSSEDVELCRFFLLEYFARERSKLGNANLKPFDLYFNKKFLLPLYAHAKITSSSETNQLEPWFAYMDTTDAKKLMESVQISFLECNKRFFGIDEEIVLYLNLKNVKTLIVKIFEINTTNYYLHNRKEIETDITLDGLISKEELIFNYSNPPNQIFMQTFSLPMISQRGVYVVEFIGNGRSSRALIRKGKLIVHESLTEDGHLFRIMDENYNFLSNVSLRVGDYYFATENGKIIVPFAKENSSQKIIATFNNFSVLEEFKGINEVYSMLASFFVDREALLPNSMATIIIRPSIFLDNRIPVSMSRLYGHSVKIFTKINNITIERICNADQLSIQNNFISVSHLVPVNCEKIEIKFMAWIKSQSTLQPQEVFATFTVKINGCMKDNTIASAYLIPTHHRNPSKNEKSSNKKNQKKSNQNSDTDPIVSIPSTSETKSYKLFIAGRCGEPHSSPQSQIAIKHIAFVDPLTIPVQPDQNGFIDLGTLNNIESVKYRDQTFILPSDTKIDYPKSINLSTSQNLILPYSKSIYSFAKLFSVSKVIGTNIILEDLSLYVNERNDSLEVKSGLPPGSYELRLRGCVISLEVEEELRDNIILGRSRVLDSLPFRPLSISNVEQIRSKDDTNSLIRFKVKNHTPTTEVFIIISQFLPTYLGGDQMMTFQPLSPSSLNFSSQQSQYASGRELSDENRYIFDRKYLQHYMGNSLPLPTMHITPFVTKTVQQSKGYANPGNDYASKGIGAQQSVQHSNVNAGIGKQTIIDNRTYDFIRFPSLFHSCKAIITGDNDEGIVEFQVDTLRFGCFAQIVAVNELYTASMNYVIQKSKNFIPLRRIALTNDNALSPEKHYVEKREVSIIQPNSQFKPLSSSSTSSHLNVKIYDSLSEIATLYSSITNEADSFANFKDVLLDWRSYSYEEKLKHYTTLASNELHYFIFAKDSEFFDAVVIPHLKEKPQKSFFDKFLLGMDLSEYLSSWKRSTLNVFELILLGYRTNKLEKIIALISEGIPLQLSKSEIELYEKALHINGKFDLVLEDMLLEPRSYFGGNKRIVRKVVRKKKLNLSMERQTSLLQMKSKQKDIKLKDKFDSEDEDEDEEVRSRSLSCSSEDESDDDDDDDTYSSPRDIRVKENEQTRIAMSNTVIKDFIKDQIEKNKTKEYVEHGYYHTLPQSSYVYRVTRSRFWVEYAEHLRSLQSSSSSSSSVRQRSSNNDNSDTQIRFLPKRFDLAGKTCSELIFALSVIDLPFRNSNVEVEYQTSGGISSASSSTDAFIVYHKEITEDPHIIHSPIMIYECFFDFDHQHEMIDGEKHEVFCGADHEYLVNKIYGAKVIVTNATDLVQNVSVLYQIPVGSVPLSNTQYTLNLNMKIEAYRSTSINYYFYFPEEGSYRHFPSHLAKNGVVLNFANETIFKVVSSLSDISQSWDSICSFGSDDAVIKALKAMKSFENIKFNDIAYRLKTVEVYKEVIRILSERLIYSPVVWEYSFFHNDIPHISEYLHNCNLKSILNFSFIQSSLFSFDPSNFTYFHREYDPVTENRIHQFGDRRKLLNDGVRTQYLQLLNYLAYKPSLSKLDLMELTYFLLLMNRLDDAISLFNLITPSASLDNNVIYNYYKCYLLFAQNNLKEAYSIASNFKDCAINHFRDRFSQIITQITSLSDSSFLLENRERIIIKESLTVLFRKRKIEISYDNNNNNNNNRVSSVMLNYYPIDIELLFSNSPFFSAASTITQFAFITPKFSDKCELPVDKNNVVIDIHPDYHSVNLMIEVNTGYNQQYFPLFYHAMKIRFIKERGLLQVVDKTSGDALSKVYIKVYCSPNGTSGGTFYKDGYTDIHGIFDIYNSNSMEKLISNRYLAILLSSENPSLGTLVKYYQI